MTGTLIGQIVVDFGNSAYPLNANSSYFSSDPAYSGVIFVLLFITDAPAAKIP